MVFVWFLLVFDGFSMGFVAFWPASSSEAGFFASEVVPCCVFPRLFPQRRLRCGGGVTGYTGFLRFLREKAEAIGILYVIYVEM